MKKIIFRGWIYILVLCLAMTAVSFAEDDGDDGGDSPALVHEHTWSEWDVQKASGCETTGFRRRECTGCGAKEEERTPALGHEAKEWTVIHEPNCQRQGRRDAVCAQCGKKMSETIPKTDHDYGEWEVTKKATEFSKGSRSATCRFCGTTKREDIYPYGTLAEGLENDPEAVKALQSELAAQGAYKGLVTGNYDYATGNAVRRLEGNWGLDQDGVAWPGFLRMLGLPGLAGRKAGEAVTKDPDGYKIRLYVKQISEEKEYYSAGDQLTYEWTLTNGSERNTLKDAALFHFDGRKSVRKTDEQVALEEAMETGSSINGTYTYTVKKDDVSAGMFSHGFQVRGILSGKEYQSNTIVFVNASGAEATGKKGWTATPKETLTVTKSVLNKPTNSFFFTEGETIRYRTEIRNGTGKTAADVIVTDELAGEKHPGTMEAGDVWVCEHLYRVTAEDAGEGEIISTAAVSYTAEGEAKQASATNSTPAGDESKGMYVRVTCTSEPANGEYYTPGEKAEFRILIVNLSTRKTFTTLKVFELPYSDYKPYRTIPTAGPGSCAICYYKAEVTAEDAAGGRMGNRVKVSYRGPNGELIVTESNECVIVCGK